MGLSYICIEFDGHHSGGSSFDLYIILLIILSVGHTHRYQLGYVLKKKSGKESQYWVSRHGNRFGSANRVGPGFGA